jgi:hypothetical protein
MEKRTMSTMNATKTMTVIRAEVKVLKTAPTLEHSPIIVKPNVTTPKNAAIGWRIRAYVMPRRLASSTVGSLTPVPDQSAGEYPSCGVPCVLPKTPHVTVVLEGSGSGSLGPETSWRKKTEPHIGVEMVTINRSTKEQIEKMTAGIIEVG